jgi:protein TonB
MPYIIFALAFHAIVLGSDLSWLKMTPAPVLSSKSLTITLSATKCQIEGASTADKETPRNEPVDKPAADMLEPSCPPPKRPPAAAPKVSTPVARQKKNLKALTRKSKPIPAPAVVRTPSVEKQPVPSRMMVTSFKPLKANNKANPDPYRGDADFIKKTPHKPDRLTKSLSTAAVQTAAKSGGAPGGSLLIRARPLYRQNASPPYPRRARRLGYEGLVMLKVLINENGRVDDLTVIQSSGHGVLDRAALSAVKNWLFEPGTEDGIKKKMWVRIPVRFDLK